MNFLWGSADDFNQLTTINHANVTHISEVQMKKTIFETTTQTGMVS